MMKQQIGAVEDKLDDQNKMLESQNKMLEKKMQMLEEKMEGQNKMLEKKMDRVLELLDHLSGRSGPVEASKMQAEGGIQVAAASFLVSADQQ